ncbi:MAG TPA: glycosyltransferase [Candidatus Atribacteria bacterium]|nr:glycosyltransferase [Candidatus Atribacteria bacterium]
MPKVSVIITVYNEERYLKEAIESILAQSFKNFELVIVNDGSTDDTAKILDHYKNKDSRMKTITHTTRMGQSKARNEAINNSSGEYIAILDADDISLPYRLEEQVKFIESHKEIGLVGSAAYKIDEKGGILGVIPVIECNEDIQKELLVRNCFVHSSIMFRREIFRKIGGYREEFIAAQDYDFILRIAENCKVHNLKRVLVKRRVNLQGISIVKNTLQKRFKMLAQQLAYQRRVKGRENMEEAVKKIGELCLDSACDIFFGGIKEKWEKCWVISKKYYGYGCIHFYKGNLKFARDLFLFSLKHNPFNIKVYLGIGATFLPFRFAAFLKKFLKRSREYWEKVEELE